MTRKIDNLLERLARHYGWNDRLDEEKAKSVFKSLLDETTAQTVTAINVKDGVLYVRMNNAAARSNLSYRLSSLLQQINEALGTPFLQEIRLA